MLSTSTTNVGGAAQSVNKGKVHLLDYGAGNIRSLKNAVTKLGFEIEEVTSPEQLKDVDSLIFPGVGAFGPAMQNLEATGYTAALKEYLQSGKPFFGICVGMQSLFEESEENPGIHGLGIIKGKVCRLNSKHKSVPHIGWNNAIPIYKYSDTLSVLNHGKGAEEENVHYYFVHSFAVPYDDSIKDWVLSVTQYADELFVSSVRKGNVFATQFHPEKSGPEGLAVIKSFLDYVMQVKQDKVTSNNVIDRTFIPDSLMKLQQDTKRAENNLTKRVIACMDVRANDKGDLVVTKGDQYDVREKDADGSGDVRNMGKPVELAKRYYEAGADEIVFLNITAFRDLPLRDQPLLELLRQASKEVFVPVTIGGGIRDTVEPSGTKVSAEDVAAAYFRAGADKVSIGSDAVFAAEKYYERGGVCEGDSSLERISRLYGSQAVVVSVDPRRRWITNKDAVDNSRHTVIRSKERGPNGEEWCWFEMTVKGGRESRDMDVVALLQASEALGAGEVLLNSIDRDGSSRGFDLELVALAKRSVGIPVVASSGAGSSMHFAELFAGTSVDAGLAAGVFHRGEVTVRDAKETVAKRGGVRVRCV